MRHRKVNRERGPRVLVGEVNREDESKEKVRGNENKKQTKIQSK